MSRIVILDSGPVGLLTQRKDVLPVEACRQWQRKLLASGARAILPEIVDYEVRRELLWIKSINGLAHLDTRVSMIEYLPLTTAAMRKAAAQALLLGEADLVVATTNVGPLSRFVTARFWQEVT